MFRDLTRSFFHRPITEQYPFEQRDVPPSLRGRLRWSPDSCTGCGLCVKDCPADAIKLFTIDKKAKRFVMAYHVDRCIYCGQCTQNCRFDCLTLEPGDWELAACDRVGYTTYYGKPEDIEQVVAQAAEDDVNAAG